MGNVQVSLNYVKPGQGDVVEFILDHAWSGSNPQASQVDVIDGASARPSLDREGFARLEFDSGVRDFTDPAQVEQVWMPQVSDLVREATGARWVVCWAPNLRYSHRLTQSQSSPVAAPAPIVHSDQTPDFDVADLATQPFGAAAGEEVARRLGAGKAPMRWKIFNVWQQLSPSPADVPLALCDLRTVTAQDVVEGHGRLAPNDEQIFKLTFYRENPAHRWLYFSDLTPGEALIFSGLDPAIADVCGRVPHTSFRMPDTGDCIPRSSIEVRTLAVFED